MIQENFYTGEPVITGSPPIFSQDVSSNMISESNKAAELASFGRYDYDASSRAAYRQQMTTQQAIYPGCYGYNNFGMQPMQPIQPMYPMGGVGIGSYPYQYGGGNPVLQPTYDMYRQPQPYFQQPQHTGTVRIPGINLGGEFLPSITSEADIARMQSEYITKYEELQAKLDYERSNSVYSNGNWGGFNYYGTGYYNPYQYNSLNQEIYKQVEAMKDEARENRILFNLKIAKLAHNIARDGVSEEDIETRYRGAIKISANGTF